VAPEDWISCLLNDAILGGPVPTLGIVPYAVAEQVEKAPYTCQQPMLRYKAVIVVFLPFIARHWPDLDLSSSSSITWDGRPKSETSLTVMTSNAEPVLDFWAGKKQYTGYVPRSDCDGRGS
jgi:hypothetical protein